MKFDLVWREEVYDCEWIEDFNVSDLDKLENLIGVHAFIFNEEGKVLVLHFSTKNAWTIPGGHPEPSDKSLIDALKREALEEADVELCDIVPIGIFSSKKRNGGILQHQVRYVARVSKILDQTIDIGTGEIPLRKFIDPKDFVSETEGVGAGEVQLQRALNVIKEF